MKRRDILTQAYRIVLGCVAIAALLATSLSVAESEQSLQERIAQLEAKLQSALFLFQQLEQVVPWDEWFSFPEEELPDESAVPLILLPAIRSVRTVAPSAIQTAKALPLVPGRIMYRDRAPTRSVQPVSLPALSVVSKPVVVIPELQPEEMVVTPIEVVPYEDTVHVMQEIPQELQELRPFAEEEGMSVVVIPKLNLEEVVSFEVVPYDDRARVIQVVTPTGIESDIEDLFDEAVAEIAQEYPELKPMRPTNIIYRDPLYP